MTEGKPVPAGRYRIDIAKEEKFMLATSGGAELGPVDATDCEMELWRINQELVKALEAIRAGVPDSTMEIVDSNVPGMRNSSIALIPMLPETLRLLKAALTAAGKGNNG